MTATAVLAERTLPELAAGIVAEHRACSEAMQKGLGHALAAGAMLMEVKARLAHGEWLPWLGDNCDVPERTCQLYMRVARNRELLEKTATVAD